MRKILTIIITALTLASCSNTKGLVEHSVEYRYIDRERVDTFYADRWHREYLKGDTIIIHDSIDRWHSRNNEIHDTTIVHDTLYEAKNVPYEVEKEPSFWEKVGLLAKGGVASILIVFAIVGLIRLVDKYRVRLKR